MLPSPGVTRPRRSFSVESSELCSTWSRSKVRTVITKAMRTSQSCVSGGTESSQVSLSGNLTRLTAKALMYLVLVPANTASPHTPLRRAAIDLIGRGFLLWEPHLEVSKVLLGLLDMVRQVGEGDRIGKLVSKLEEERFLEFNMVIE